jgi:hypothetical protein
MAWEIVMNGRKHASADALCHRIRAEMYIEGDDERNPKLNNDFTAFYARKWQREYPQLASLFRTRAQPSKQRAAHT